MNIKNDSNSLMHFGRGDYSVVIKPGINTNIPDYKWLLQLTNKIDSLSVIVNLEFDKKGILIKEDKQVAKKKRKATKKSTVKKQEEEPKDEPVEVISEDSDKTEKE